MEQKNILVVDDNQDLIYLIKGLLEDVGYKVLGAGDGQIALELCKKNKIDLIITDINMPNMNGLELMIELHKNYAHIPIFTISGSGKIPENNLAISEQIGAKKTYNKPFQIKQFVADINQLLKPGNQKSVSQ